MYHHWGWVFINIIIIIISDSGVSAHIFHSVSVYHISPRVMRWSSCETRPSFCLSVLLIKYNQLYGIKCNHSKFHLISWDSLRTLTVFCSIRTISPTFHDYFDKLFPGFGIGTALSKWNVLLWRVKWMFISSRFRFQMRLKLTQMTFVVLAHQRMKKQKLSSIYCCAEDQRVDIFSEQSCE